MSAACRSFRHLLEAALAGRPDPRRLVRLGWHEHLAACEPCRALLDQEEALELLLASLPEPRLPPDVTRRVLERLRASRERELERLLELDRVTPPSGLAARVLAGVRRDRARAGSSRSPRAREEARLDALLDAAGQVVAPEGLAERVLAGLVEPLELSGSRSSSRGPGHASSRGPGSVAPRRRLAAAAALVIVGGLAAHRILIVGPRGLDPDDRHVAELADERVIQSLPVLESWEALAELDPLELAIVGQLDLADEALLEQDGAR